MAHTAGTRSIARSIATPPLGGTHLYTWYNTGTHLYTWVKRGTVRVIKSVLPKSTTQWPRPGLTTGPIDPESSTLTTRQPRLPHCFKKRGTIIIKLCLNVTSGHVKSTVIKWKSTLQPWMSCLADPKKKKKWDAFVVNFYYLWADWAIWTIIDIRTVSNQVLEMVFKESKRQIN